MYINSLLLALSVSNKEKKVGKGKKGKERGKKEKRRKKREFIFYKLILETKQDLFWKKKI